MPEVPHYILKLNKPQHLQKAINEALYILSKLGVPLEGMSQRRMERMAMAFLAVANVKRSSDWLKADRSHALRTREIIRYWNNNFNENISESSYDDIRRKDLKLSVLAEIIKVSSANPNAARKDGTRAFALNHEYAALIKAFGSDSWEDNVENFLANKVTLEEQLASKRDLRLIPVNFPSGKSFEFSPGKHNELQKAIIEEFLPRYGYSAEVLYVGDTANKLLHIERERLEKLNFFAVVVNM